MKLVKKEISKRETVLAMSRNSTCSCGCGCNNLCYCDSRESIQSEIVSQGFDHNNVQMTGSYATY